MPRRAAATAPTITVRGAREHNLKNVNVDLPRDKLIVFTGLSGSGKSSLAFDTIYAEGQRRYVESLSSYARQFLGQMDKPDVDVIEGLSPAISIDQKSAGRNPRSTVGTITEVYDYLRLLYARIGVQHCPNDGTRLQRQTPQQIVDRILELPEGTRFQVLAPVVRGRKGEYDTLLEDLVRPGLRAGPHRRRGRRHRRVPQARRAPGPLRAAQDRDRRRPLVHARGHRAAAHRLARDGAALAEGVAEIEIVRREARRRGRDNLTFSQHLVVPDVRAQLRGAGAAQLLVQLAVRRLRDVRRARHHVRDRPRAGRPRPRPVASTTAPSPRGARRHTQYFHAHARRGRRAARHRPRRAVGEAHGQAAEDPPARRRRAR